MRLNRLKGMLALVLAMSLFAAACGGSSGGNDNATDTTTESSDTTNASDDEATADDTKADDEAMGDDEAKADDAAADDEAMADDEAKADDEATADDEAMADEAAAADDASADSGEAKEIRWFVGLGAGTDAPVIPLEQEIVDEFNETKPLGDNITLKMEVVGTDAPTVLQTQIAGGNAPDIVGPMGVKGSATFEGGWLDMAPYLEKYDYDLSDFAPEFVDFWKLNGVQIGIPFGAFPQMIWYNSALFDEAGLAYPPTEFGAPYVDADGNEKPWNTDTLREIAKELAVDENGLTPNDDGFDPDAQVQWGYCGNVQTGFRGAATMFGAGNFIGEDQKTFEFPDQWKDFAQWYQDGIHVDHSIPTLDYRESDLLANPSPLGSGNCAMMNTHTWFKGWGTGELPFDEFDTAAVPAGPDGTITAKLHADTFGIPESSKNPDEAFQVIEWMLSAEQGPKLATVYGALPARISAQDAYINDPENDAGFNWQVALDALNYPDNPSHEAWLPNYVESEDAILSWWEELQRDPNADVNAAADKLGTELQPIFDRGEG